MSNEIDTRIVRWLGGLGAATPADVASHLDLSAAAARSRLAALDRGGLLRSSRLLHGQPPLYVATRAGLRAVGLGRLEVCRVSTSGFSHLRACAQVAVALQRGHPRALVIGERELRLAERDAGQPLASAEVGLGRNGEPALHRPDLVVWGTGAPIAIEVELTVKSHARLRAILIGWGRCRLVGDVVYYASPPAARALARVVSELRLDGQVTVVALDDAATRPLDRVALDGVAVDSEALDRDALDRAKPSQAPPSLGATDSQTEGDPQCQPATSTASCLSAT